MNPSVRDVDRIVRAALRAVDPFEAVRRSMVDAPASFAGARKIHVVGAGKAAVPMAEAVFESLGDLISDGLVITKRGHGEVRPRVGAIEIAVGGHPLPNADGVRAAERIEGMLRDGACEDDLVLVLLSGGGSSLLALPEPDLSLDDLRAVGDALILGGAEIGEINTVRKHLTRLSGGRLARLAAPARIVSLILSDVIGDPLDVIASGPTAPDPTTFVEALAVIERLGLETSFPGAALAHLRRGAAGAVEETPKPGDPIFDRAENRLVAGNAIAVTAAAEEARALGFSVEVASTALSGEARERGAELARRAFAIERGDGVLAPPTCLLHGGETTVTVRGKGRGGRNQELALAAALELERLGAHRTRVVAFSTDGQDGPTDAAGAIADVGTCSRIRAAGVDPLAALEDNDSHSALDAAGVLIRTGPTLTNVADIALVLVER